jgi:YbbR domain-containing protein
LRRALILLVRNWPLKVAALLLAILLYGVVVIGQNARIFPGSIPIVAVNEPTTAYLLSNLPNVTEVRYLANDPSIRVDSSSFQATVDLDGVDPAAGTVSLPVTVRAGDTRVRVLGWSPDRVQVQIDQVVEEQVPIKVNKVSVPPNLDVRDAVLSQEVATVRGPASVVHRVDHVEARVQIDPAGLDFDRDVKLIPVDVLGEAVPQPVKVDPEEVRIRIAVFTNSQSRTLPVAPNVVGTPAPGFEVTAITVSPLIVNVEGDADELSRILRADTAPVSVDGATADLSSTVDLALPTGIVQIGDGRFDVTVTIRPVTGSRTFNAGIALTGARGDRTYQLSTDSVLITAGGSIADLDRLQAQTLEVTAAVGSLSPGTHQVNLAATLPTGVTLLTISPPRITIVVGVPSPSQGAASGSTAPSQAP